MNFRKILVPVDFSEYSDQSVKLAITLAAKFCAQITLFHSVLLFHEDIDEEEHLEAFERLVETKEAKRLKVMNAHCKMANRRGVDVKSVLKRGYSAADTILEHLNEKKYDLVIMGTHGRTGLTKWVLGSVAEKVVRHSRSPVLTVHKDWRVRLPKAILIPVDFSRSSKKAVRQGTALAKSLDAKVTILFAVEQEDHPAYYASSFEPILKVNPKLKKDIKANLVKFAGIPDSEVRYAIVEGKAHDKIKEYAETKRISMIVMATHGMSELEHFLAGSTTERVVALSPCPVLSIRRD
jgi:nucleotide-binding universal stress UspA family protein